MGRKRKQKKGDKQFTRPNPRIPTFFDDFYKQTGTAYGEFLMYAPYCLIIEGGKEGKEELCKIIAQNESIDDINKQIEELNEEIRIREREIQYREKKILSLEKKKKTVLNRKKEMIEAINDFDSLMTKAINDTRKEINDELFKRDDNRERRKGKVEKMTMAEVKAIAKKHNTPLKFLFEQVTNNTERKRWIEGIIGCEKYFKD